MSLNIPRQNQPSKTQMFPATCWPDVGHKISLLYCSKIFRFSNRNMVSVVETSFFSSSMADVALWLGSYMSINSKTSLYKDRKGLEMQANHNKPTITQTSQTTRKSQPDLRFVKETANQTHKKGKSPNKKPTKRFAIGHSGLTTASHSKTCIQ